ncbi:MAG: hypothetical protein MUE67_03155 [Anaerolineales bacterium]|nr:hypothetical protein [Anaerolineales bacterium]
MAAFANQPATALAGVVNPVGQGNVTGIYPIMSDERFGATCQKFGQAHGQRGEATVETDHQFEVGIGWIQESTFDFGQLSIVER